MSIESKIQRMNEEGVTHEGFVEEFLSLTALTEIWEITEETVNGRPVWVIVNSDYDQYWVTADWDGSFKVIYEV